jgi:hypothetical protein
MSISCCNTNVSQYDNCRNCNIFFCSKHIKKDNVYNLCYKCYNKKYTCVYCERIYEMTVNDIKSNRWSRFKYDTCRCGKFICKKCNNTKSSSKCYGCYKPTCKSKLYTIDCSNENCTKSMNIPLCCDHPNKDKLIYNSKKFKYCEIDTKIVCSSCTSRCRCCNVYTNNKYILSYKNTKYTVVCYKCFLKIFKIQQWWKLIVYNPNSNYCKKMFDLYLTDEHFINN